MAAPRVRSTRARAALAAALVLLGGALAGCRSGTPSAGPSARPSAGPTTSEPSATASVVPASPTPSTTPSTTPPTTSPTTSPAGPVPIDKVLVLVVENHSLDAMRSQMPWTYALARRYGYATGYRGVTHPSLPNYLAISGGDTFGVADDHDPSAHPLSAPSVFGQALGSGHTAKVYAEDMPGACATSSSGRYAVRHNPWTYHVSERSACRRYDVPMTAFAADVRAGRLPNAGMVVPNLCHDAHDCPAASADAWLRTVVGSVLAGPDFRSGRLLVVITADEDDHTQGNLVLTALVNPQLEHRVVSSALDHYSLSRLYSEVLGVAPLRQAASAPSLVSAFGLRVAPAR